MLSFMKGFCSGIPQRWVFAVMGFLALLNAYSMRVCLSLAITEMVVDIPKNDTIELDEHTCPSEPKPLTNGTSSMGTKYEWDQHTQGIILSSFYWGYILTHLPGGILSEKFGGKYSLGLGIFSTAIFTVITPFVVEWKGSTGLIILRFLMGLGEGVTFPALNVMVAQWTPPEERSKIGSIVFAGAQLGTVFANTVGGLVLHNYSWQSVFYIFGAVSVLWCVVWVFTCYNSPQEHPYISEGELKFLQDRLGAHTHKKPPSIPWSHVLRSAPVWALVAAQIGHDWGFFTMVTDLPLYMSKVLKFDIKSNGYLSSLPYLFMLIFCLITSWLADWLIVRGHMSRTNVRKLGTTIASLGPGFFIVAASYAQCDKAVVVTLFTIGMTLMGTFYPGMKVNSLDLSPNYSGTLMALVNGIGAFTGILTPYLVGVLTPHENVVEWRLVFWIVLAVFVATNIIFVCFASGEVQYWNDPEFVREEREKNRLKKIGNVYTVNSANTMNMDKMKEGRGGYLKSQLPRGEE